MENTFLNDNIEKILTNNELNTTKRWSYACVWILSYLKGVNLKLIDVSEVSPLADYFVLASATNTTQAKSMAEELTRIAKKNNIHLISQEGNNDAEWILIDFGDVIVHIFLESHRDIFGLDQLWKDAPREPIPETFYFSSHHNKGDDEDGDSSKSPHSYF